MLRSLKLSHRFALLIGVVTIGFCLFGWQCYLTIKKIQVNGPIYSKIIQGKDLVADALPPPIYVIESYLIALRLSSSATKGQQTQLIQQLTQQRQNYFTKISYWEKQSLSSQLHQKLLSTSHRAAIEFYETAINRLIPAVQNGDRESVNQIISELNQVYETHRQAIDLLVGAINTENSTSELQALNEINLATTTLILVWVICVLAGIAVSSGILAQLHERESFINAVVSDAADGIITIDSDGNITSFNHAAETIFAYPESEVLGVHVKMLMPIIYHAALDSFLCEYPKQKQSFSINREVAGLRKNGEQFPLDLAISEIHKVGKPSFTGIVRDISRRKQTEAALSYSESRFQLAMRGANDGLWDWDVDQARVYYSPRWISMLGFNESDYSDTFEEWKKSIHPQDVDYAVKELNRHLDGLSDSYQCEFRVRHKHGHYLWVLSRAYADRDANGRALRVVGTHTDITERKQLEQLKSEFISTVSHELRTPLTSIRGSLGLLNNGVMGTLSVQAKTLTDLAYRNTERLLGLINDLLDMDKLQSGNLEIQMELIELTSLVQHVIDINCPFAAQFNIRFETRFCEQKILVRGDSLRLLQVLTNLLTNAAKFSKENTVTTISLSRPQENMVRLSIADVGIGIPEHFREKIFEKFTQVDSSDVRHKGGIGLGLCISKALVEKMHGKISVESEVGLGSTFHIDLPTVVSETKIKADFTAR